MEFDSYLKSHTGLTIYDFDVLSRGTGQRQEFYSEVMRIFQDYKNICFNSEVIEAVSKQIHEIFYDVEISEIKETEYTR